MTENNKVLASLVKLKDRVFNLVNTLTRWTTAHRHRRRTLAELEANERLFRTVLETLPVGVWITNAEGKIIIGNTAGKQIWAGERYVGIENYQVYRGWWVESGKQIEAEEWALARAIRHGETSLDELIRIQCFDGSFKTILNSAIPIRDDAGSISGAFVAIQDISERVRIEEELRRVTDHLEELVAERTRELTAANTTLRVFEKIVMHSPNWICVIDREHRYTVVNESLLKSFTRDFLEHRIEDLMDDDSRDDITSALEQSFSGVEVTYTRWRMWPELGRRFAEFTYYPIADETGVVEYVVILMRDITEMQTAQEEVRKAKAELEQRVIERTAALRDVNVALIKQVADREAAEIRLHHYTKRLETLRKLDQSILATEVPEEIARTALNFIKQMIPMDCGLIISFNQNLTGGTILAVSFDGTREAPTLPKEFEQHGVQSLLRHPDVLDQGKPIIINDIQQASPIQYAPGVLMLGCMRSYLDAPLRAESKLVGMLRLMSRVPGTFTPDHSVVAMEIANSLALSIRSTQLLQSVKDQSRLLRALAARLTEVEESERKRLSQVLHDQVGQNLAVLSLNLNLIKNLNPINEPIRARLDNSLDIVDETIDRTRNLIADLRPPVLDDYGLPAALGWYAKQFTTRTTIPVATDIDDDFPRLPALSEINLFRIVQESLANVAKHAQATEARLGLHSETDVIRLTVSDNGRGFELASVGPRAKSDRRTTGYGIISMSERAEAIGGSLKIESIVGQGTIVNIELHRESALT